MRITKEKAQENRTLILDAAARLYREHGFDGIGLADVMRAAGLTHGGFYNHFDSKEQLEEHACTRVFEQAVARIETMAAQPAPRRREAFEAYVRAYLSTRSRDAGAARCPMVAFGADMSRQGACVKRAYAHGLELYLDALSRALPETRDDGVPRGDATARRQEATDLLAHLVGSLALARSVSDMDPALSDSILTRGLDEALRRHL